MKGLIILFVIALLSLATQANAQQLRWQIQTTAQKNTTPLSQKNQPAYQASKIAKSKTPLPAPHATAYAKWQNVPTKQPLDSPSALAQGNREIKRLLTQNRLQTPHPIAPKKSEVIYPGSLKANIQRIAHRFGWPIVVWHYPNDFNWVGKTTIHAQTAEVAFSDILEDYPLEAVFYKGNHVIVIMPRTLL